MSVNTTDLTHLIERMESRIDDLEKSNRRWARGATALVLTAALSLPFLPSDTNAKKGSSGKTIVAERVALMNGKKVGMLLSAKGGMNKVSFHGPAGNVRMTLSTNKKGQPMISLNDPAQKPRLNLRYTKKHGAHWTMFGNDGKGIVKRLK